MLKQYIFTLGPEIAKYAKEHLNETEETREKGLNEIRKWLSEEKPDLNARTEARYILPFLRKSKFNFDETKASLIAYYNLRRDNPRWFTNRDPASPEIQELVKLGVFVPLRKLYKNQLVILVRTAVHDPSKHSQEDVFKTDHLILDVAALFEFEAAQICGVISVFDMKGVSLGHATALKPAIVKRAVTSWQNYHVTSKSFEFINSPTYLNVILSVFKSFMNETMKKSVKVHTKGLESLHGIVDKELLPEEYGGTDGKLSDLIDFWNEKLLAKREWFLEDEKYRAN